MYIESPTYTAKHNELIIEEQREQVKERVRRWREGQTEQRVCTWSVIREKWDISEKIFFGDIYECKWFLKQHGGEDAPYYGFAKVWLDENLIPTELAGQSFSAKKVSYRVTHEPEPIVTEEK